MSGETSWRTLAARLKAALGLVHEPLGTAADHANCSVGSSAFPRWS